MRDIRNIARYTVTGARNSINTMYRNASTEDIINVIHHADNLAGPYTAEFAKQLNARHSGNVNAILQDVWSLLKGLRYKADDGHQKIKSPAQLIKDGVGDCKSYSVFIASVLQNLGIPYKYRYADYDRDNDVNHVYIIAQPENGPQIVVDAVHTAYNREAPGANLIFDIDPITQQRTPGKRIAGIERAGTGNLAGYVVGVGVVLLILILK